MGKIAFVFSGQGAQYPGMGQELAQISQAAADVFKNADAIRPGTSSQCFSGTEEELKTTCITQPCMFAVETAAAAVLSENGITADMAAGFSLGEIAALTYSRAVDFKTGFELVIKRGELMQAAAEATPSAMVAVLKLQAPDVEKIAAEFRGIYPVNYNCPGQTAVAGLEETMPEFTARIKEAGGRALPIKVRGGFHSPFMEGASEKFAEVLAKLDISVPETTLYSNKTGEPYPADTEVMRKLLAKQICSPVRWETIVRNMIAEGVDTFIELGPGNTLCGLISKTDPAVRAYPLCTKEDLDKILTEVKPC